MAPRTAWGTAPRALNTPTMEPPSRRTTAGCNDTDLPAVRRTLGRSDRFHIESAHAHHAIRVMSTETRCMLVDDQVPIYLGRAQKVLMRPDIVVSEGETVVLVADCKYKRLEPDEFKNHDIYQMLAYCTATRVQRGLLIYPLHAAVIQDEVEIRNTQTVVR